MEFTGERFVPELPGQIALEHMHRYLAASEIASGKEVLDIACGEGYGSSILAQHARKVIGVDISVETVQHARKRYTQDNIEFIAGSCTDIPLPDASIDLVVSFETIEHIAEHDQMMKEIKRVLRPDGALIISSPDKYHYSDEAGYHNPFHAKELYLHEFKKLLETYFQNISLSGQRVTYGSNIFSNQPAARVASYYQEDEVIEYGPGVLRPVYRIAIASDAQLPEIASSVLEKPVKEANIVKDLYTVVADHQRVIDELNELIRQAATDRQQILDEFSLLNRQFTHRQALINSLTSQLAESETRLQAMELEAFDRETRIESLSEQVNDRIRENENLKAELSRLQDEIVEYASSDSWRITRPLRKKNKYFQNTLSFFKNIDDYFAIQRSGLFDHCYYLKNNQDVRQADVDPLLHFLQDGWKDGRAPSAAFDTGAYLAVYADAAASGINPLLHYLRYGKSAGRDPRPVIAPPLPPENDHRPSSVGVESDWLAAEAMADELLDYPDDQPVNIPACAPVALSPKVSVCIPVYNGGEYLRACIHSILCQSYPYFELLIVNDASTDDSRQIIESFNDPRIRYVENDHNLGLVGNWNHCLELSTGEYITIFHQDDQMRPYNLAKKIALLEAEPQVGMVFSDTIVIDETGRVLSEHWYNALEPNVDFIRSGRSFFDLMFSNLNVVNCPSVMARRTCYERVGGFDARLPFTVDMEMWMRMALFYDVAYLAEALIAYRSHPTNLTQRFMHYDLMHVYLCKRILCEKYPEKLDASYQKSLMEADSQRMYERAVIHYDMQEYAVARRYLAFLKKIRAAAGAAGPLDQEIAQLIASVNPTDDLDPLPRSGE